MATDQDEKNVITHPDKILFPESKTTKQDVVNYYRTASKWMLPFLKDRPLVMERFPNGIKKEGFFQKNVPESIPSSIKTIDVEREGQEKGHLLLCQNLFTLLYLANLNCLTPHIWLSTKSKIDCPDKLVFDLDPPKGKFPLAREAALGLRRVLEKDLKLKAYVMTTGSRGLHVVVPIKAELSFDDVREFAKKVANVVVLQNPKLFTTEIRKSARKGRVYIDVMRNAYAQHSVAPYAIRPLPGAPIAMPISWVRLSKVEAQTYTLQNSKKSFKSDPWKGFSSNHRSIKNIAKNDLKFYS